MTAQNDGGPAFPHWVLDGEKCASMPSGGMTLRDYFAANAMQGFIASPRSLVNSDGSPKEGVSASDYATVAYLCADAMLEARGVNS